MRANLIFAFFLLICGNCYAQPEEYAYQREIYGITDTWHRVTLPNEVFKHVSGNLSDIRIFGITADSGIVEAPYLLREKIDKISRNEIDFTIINPSRGNGGYYFTFEIPAQTSINEVMLNFEEENFDWRVTLEGSQNQQAWYTLLDNYRILSIQNELTDYQFTTLNFPDAKYNYYRVFIRSNEAPELSSAQIASKKVSKGQYRSYDLKTFKTVDKQRNGKTEVTIELNTPVPVSRLRLRINNTYDYYRPITIQSLADSFKTEKGWKYIYRILGQGTLSSLGENEFTFKPTILQKLKIIITNNDNESLSVGAAEVAGPIQELIARFTTPAEYYLAYGKSSVTRPNYDIARFENHIPDTLSALRLGGEKQKNVAGTPQKEPLFENKIWLWSIMIAIIALLGWFTLQIFFND